MFVALALAFSGWALLGCSGRICPPPSSPGHYVDDDHQWTKNDVCTLNGNRVSLMWADYVHIDEVRALIAPYEGEVVCRDYVHGGGNVMEQTPDSKACWVVELPSKHCCYTVANEILHATAADVSPGPVHPKSVCECFNGGWARQYK